MATVNADIEFWSGNDIELDVEILKEDDTPLDLSGAIVRWALTSAYDLSTVLVTKDSDVAGGVSISSGGQVTISIDNEDTVDFGGQPYYHELVVDYISGALVTVLVGNVTINKTAIGNSSPGGFRQRVRIPLTARVQTQHPIFDRGL